MSKLQPQPWTTAKKPAADNDQPARRLSPTGKGAAGSSKWPALARWLHLYLSMVSFALVLFFAVTGLTLNHANWFDDAATTIEYKGQVDARWVNPTDTARIDKLAIVEFLRTTHGIRGAVSDFRIDDRQCSVSFRGPGYTADAFVDRPAGTYQLTETKLGLMAVMNDLHKGRDTGKGWAWVIDVTAVFMTLVSLTGLVLLLFLKKRRGSGLRWALIGLAAGLALYLWLVD
ncbi:PepSY-associated TM helix domain-containing protein [Spirosoma rigui]|uniref:PepSY-associated TM helix domain-containing protein n=1 Tax=Spirosoma rigui TaxID=564064 RepID=UPI0009B08367|nr:PepSY-associated TM helix domain-containing protein [Spirosoma rigui]